MTFKQCIFLIALLFTSLSCQSNINRIEVEIKANRDTYPVDSLKYALTGLRGINYVAMSPDTSHLTLKYDRYKTHSDVILKCISDYGYNPRLITKESVSYKKEASQ